MRIDEVSTAVRVGEFRLRRDGNANRIKFHWESALSREAMLSNQPRVYLFAVDSVIRKIGGSASRGGIKSTLAFYENSMAGSPGAPRFVIHLLIEKELSAGRSVSVHMITAPMTLAVVPGLFGTHQMEIASFKEMEDRCKQDYIDKEGRFPVWNFQENHEPYPDWAARLHNEYHTRRLQ